MSLHSVPLAALDRGEKLPHVCKHPWDVVELLSTLFGSCRWGQRPSWDDQLGIVVCAMKEWLEKLASISELRGLLLQHETEMDYDAFDLSLKI